MIECVHPAQEPPGYDLSKHHYAKWCDDCHRTIWYEELEVSHD